MTEASEAAPVAAARSTLPKWLIIGSSVFLTALVLLSHPPYTNPLDYIGYALRVTAWLAFSYFLVAYVARPLVTVYEQGWPRRFGVFALRNRRYFGLAAAYVHTIHFGYVAVFLLRPEVAVEFLTVLLGGTAFLLLWAMALTSNTRGLRTLGPRWKWLHRTGMHYLWVVFAYTLFGSVGLSFVSSLLFAAALLAALLRFAAWRQTRAAAAP